MNFKELDRLIHSNQKRIALTSDVVLEDGEELIYKNGIDIDLNGLILDGNGHTIDARDKVRIFNIRANLQVIITNLVFKNGLHNQGGGAICNFSKYLALGYCTFNHNSANEGGAIYNHAFIKATDCNFIYNYSRNCQDIYNWDMLILKQCTFKNPNEKIIFNLNEVKIEECSFEPHHVIETNRAEFGHSYQTDDFETIKNSQETSHGGASNEDVDDDSNSVFKQLRRVIDSLDNDVSIDEKISKSLNLDNVNDFIDAAIDSIADYNEVVREISKSRKRIEANKSTSDVLSFSDLKEMISQNDEVFLECDVAFTPDDECLKEGIKLVEPNYFKIDSSCVVLDNDLVIDGKGHSIDAKGMARIFALLNPKLTVTFRDISFKNAYFIRASGDDYLSDGGSVIYNEGNCRFEFCEFLNGYASFSAAAVYNYRGTMSFFECLFDNNRSDASAGAIFNNSGDLEFINCIFINNSSVEAGAVLCDFLGKLKFNRCCFKDNSTQFKGIIALAHNVSFDFDASVFLNNTVKDDVYIYKTGFF